MPYTYTLTTRQQTIMDAKASAAKTTVKELIDAKMAEYIDACARDVGQDVDARIAKALASKDAATKAQLLTTLEAA